MEYLEVFLAALSTFILGFIWYAPLFGKIWQRETGLTAEDVQSGMAVTHGVSFLMMLIIAYLMSYFWGGHIHDGSIGHGAFHGMQGALFSALPLLVINYLYQRKSFTLMLIDGLYAIAFFALMGAVLSGLKLCESPTPSAEDLKESIEWAEEFLKTKKDALDAFK